MLLTATGYAAAGDKSPPTWTIITCYLLLGNWRWHRKRVVNTG